MVLCSLCLYGDPRWHGLPKEFWNPHSTYQKKQFEENTVGKKTDDKPEVAFEKDILLFCVDVVLWSFETRRWHCFGTHKAPGFALIKP